jgi:hypothetical protein
VRILTAGILIFGALVAAVTIRSAETEKKQNLLVFDGEPSLHARVDGKDVGALAVKELSVITGLVVELTPGAHAIEIVDGKGTVVEKGKVSSVPAQGYRALYAVGESHAYAYVQVGYGETPEGDPIRPMPAADPHVFVVPAGAFISRAELGLVNEPFPDSVKTKYTFTRHGICRLNGDGEPGCL